jgi:hypothetical protein
MKLYYFAISLILIVIIIVFGIVLIANNDILDKNKIKQIHIYKNGVLIKQENFNIILLDDVADCIENTVDSVELLVDEERVNIMKNNSSSIEIVFLNDVNIRLKGRNRNFIKIFIPLSGKYQNVLFLGSSLSGYSPYPPYVLKNCVLVQKAVQIIEKTY